jgi:hypothetical protein
MPNSNTQPKQDDIKVNGQVKRKMKMTEGQQDVQKEAAEFTESLKAQREELTKERGEQPVTSPAKQEGGRAKEELSRAQNLEVLNREQTINISVGDLTTLIAVARGETQVTPHLVHQLPEDASTMDRVHLIADDALAEVGRGAHRVMDGLRDIGGGLIDIVTLGRAHRK